MTVFSRKLKLTFGQALLSGCILPFFVGSTAAWAQE
jgi:hypothetical protein